MRCTTEFGRIYIELNGESYEPAAKALDKVFGLHSYSPAYTCELELDKIQAKALELMQARVSAHGPGTFKVSVRRANRGFPYNSQQMNSLVGGYVLQAMEQLRVDVHRPDTELRIELRQDRALLYTEILEGAGGFPAGTSGKAMLMLSGGIDSPVAGWLAMRRGLELEAVHFHSYPYTSERAKQKVIDLTAKLAEYAGEMTLHLVPFTEIQTRIHQAHRTNLLITLLRRAMFRITERLAERRKALAIVTGESLGQVASQTLPSLVVSRRSVELPILQPLIMMDKEEIIRIAERIETYPISILPYDDCCTLFVPPSPSTNPNLRIVEKLENRMEWLPGLLEDAVERTETVVVSAKRAAAHQHLF
jgi:thiamine biosynthesis protein ThiI